MSRFFRWIARVWMDFLHVGAHAALAAWLLLTGLVAGRPVDLLVAMFLVILMFIDIMMFIVVRRQRDGAHHERKLAQLRFEQACRDITVLDNAYQELAAQNAKQAQTILAFGQIEQHFGVQRKNGEHGG
jgi:hypothetical protein